MPPLSLPSLSASTIKRTAKLLAAALRTKLPPPLLQQLITNPALFRMLFDELVSFVGADAAVDVLAADEAIKSRTAKALHDALGQLPQFQDFRPDDWHRFGQYVKQNANTAVVFTGALPALLLSALQNRKLLPMTRHYGIEIADLAIAQGLLKRQYRDRYLDFLVDGGVLEASRATTKQALKAHHTKQDEKNAKQRPTSMTTIYTAGDALPGIVSLLGNLGVRIANVLANVGDNTMGNEKRDVIATLLKAQRRDLANAVLASSVASPTVTAGRRQVVYLGNTGPNNSREWVVVQYRNRPNGNGEKVAKVSVRQGVEPDPGSNVQWTDIPYLRQYLQNVRHKLSRPGVMLLNKLARV